MLPSLRDGQFLGRGAFKNVIAKVRNGGPVAVMTSDANDLSSEAALMRSLLAFPHPHVLPLLATESTLQASVAIVAPVALFGSIYDLVDHLDFENMTLSFVDISVTTLQVAEAVLHLAKLGIDHGDVCAKNVLVMNYDPDHATRMHVCLADFGQCRLLRNSAVLSASLASLVRELYALAEC